MSNEIKSREEIVKNIHSKKIILMPDGSEMNIDSENPQSVKNMLKSLNDESLSKYIISDELGLRNEKKEPPSIKVMQKHELIDYEPASDSGNFKFFPKGHLMFDLLKKWAEEIAVNKLNAMQIDTPIIYDWNDPEIKEQAGSFHERHYSVKVPDDPEKDFILRFAGDFGLFKIMKKANFSYKMLPLRIYEFSKSFRYEKSGELSGLKRLRAFHMPDIHCFCKNLEEGFEEYELLFKNYTDLANAVGIEYAVSFRIVEEFYNKHKDKIVNLLKYLNRPAFVELISSMKHYWVIKHEFQGIDSVSGCVQLSTVQLDIKDANVYGIRYVDNDGSKKGCIICHSSIGSIERWIYLIIENALKLKNPVYPLWLSPTQLRIIPVSAAQLEYCKNISIPAGIRCDIDDSEETLAKKIAHAGLEWIPYVAVIGNNEAEANLATVNNRFDGSQKLINLANLFEEIIRDCGKMPFKPLPVAKFLSKRPIFFG